MALAACALASGARAESTSPEAQPASPAAQVAPAPAAEPAPPAPPAKRDEAKAAADDDEKKGPSGYKFPLGRAEGTVGLNFRFAIHNDRDFDFSDAKPDGQRTFNYTRVKPSVGVRWEGYRVLVEAMDSHELREFGRTADPAARKNQDTFDLHQAFVEAKRIGGTPLFLKVGRQEFSLGAARLVSTSRGPNLQQAFDLARAGAEAGSFKGEVFFGRRLVLSDDGFDQSRAGQNFVGAWSTTRLMKQLSLDAYLLAVHDQVFSDPDRRKATKGEDGVLGAATRYSPGVRLFGAALDRRLDYQAELVYQLGNRANDTIRAWGGHASAGWRFDAPFSPKVRLEGTYASGDQDPKDGVSGSFNALFGRNYEPYGLADVVRWQNMKELAASVYAKPFGPLNAGVEYHHFWIDSVHEDFVTFKTRNTFKGVPVGESSPTDLGHELDVRLRADFFGERLFLEGLWGVFLPGGFIERTGAGDAGHHLRLEVTLAM